MMVRMMRAMMMILLVVVAMVRIYAESWPELVQPMQL